MKLKSKSDVVEWYWPDFLSYCMRTEDSAKRLGGFDRGTNPTVDNFWKWYISIGPLALKVKGHYYNKTEVEYV